MRLTSLVIMLCLGMTGVASAAAPEGGSSPFAGQIYQAIAAAIVFVLLIVILKKMAWGPILQGLVDREKKISGDLAHAQEAARQATATLEQYRKQLAEAHAEARRIIDQGRADAEKVAAGLQKQAEAEINSLRVRAQAEIASAREQAVAELYSQAATLATGVASRILQRELNPADQQRLVEESLGAFQKSAQN